MGKKVRAAINVSGCILGGAIGDAFGGIPEHGRICLSDDTQMTLATCEAIMAEGGVSPASIAALFRSWYVATRFSGLGSSTLKALRDLEFGAHWAIAGARGEMAAGNGGAMRIAPLAFILDTQTDRQIIRDVVSITHRNDEAYLGALAIMIALQQCHTCNTASELLQLVASELPDSRIRDQLWATAQLANQEPLAFLAQRFGSSGFVVETVPLSLVAGYRSINQGLEVVIKEIIAIGGDTDTIASIAGQLSGAQTGVAVFPESLVNQLPEKEWISDIADRFSRFVEGYSSDK
jgi:ADP-ribosyl-[dinitrogen reductase] hydrolase